MSDAHHLAGLAADLALTGGSRAMLHFGRLDQLTFEEKPDIRNSAANLVSEADRDVEALLRRRLAEERPEDGFAGEETEEVVASRSGLTWVIDPIDGTLNFAYGRPDWVVSVAVVDETGASVAGAIYIPVLGSLYVAARDEGATLNGVALRPKVLPGLSHALLELGHGRVLSPYLPAIVEEFTPTRGMRRSGSAALALSSLASGEADAVYLPELKHWDYAAGLLIAQEAGARCEQFQVDGVPVLLGAVPSVYDDYVAGVGRRIALEPVPHHVA